MWNVELKTNPGYYYYYMLLKAYKPSQPHRVTSGLCTKSNLTEVEYNTKHAHFPNKKYINIIRKLVPSVIALIIKANKVRR